MLRIALLDEAIRTVVYISAGTFDVYDYFMFIYIIVMLYIILKILMRWITGGSVDDINVLYKRTITRTFKRIFAQFLLR